MKKLNNEELKKIQAIELEMLIEFDRICKKHNIKYNLAGGSCLGAIRHKGFIPWDDDIDIVMFRKEYEKFIEVQKNELNKKKYYFESLETEDNCGILYAKIKRKNSVFAEDGSKRDINTQGIWIDIFPLDNISDNKLIAKFYFYHIFILKMIMMYQYGYISSSSNKKKNLIIKMIRIISIFYKKERLKTRLNKMVKKYNSKDTKTIVSFAGVYFSKELMPKSIFQESIECKFERHNIYIPKEYDAYMKQFYGDYMKLPPQNKRYTHHEIIELKFPNE